MKHYVLKFVSKNNRSIPVMFKILYYPVCVLYSDDVGLMPLRAAICAGTAQPQDPGGQLIPSLRRPLSPTCCRN